MLFNSYPFLFVFLPIALLGYQIAGHFHRRAVVAWLGFVSLAFYTYWRPPFVFLLVTSIAMNYTAAALISRQIPNRIGTRVWLWVAIAANLAALGYFKYLFPLLNFLSSATGVKQHWGDVVLPLGISFFTFTQIAFLVDLQQGAATQQDFSSYVLFVTFFPHLIAGPILHHKEIMPQFQQDRRYRLSLSDVSVGFSWFIMGLGKKVLLADTFAASADLAFGSASPLSSSWAWRGALNYALQLYFDFSGYSDMALGLARMFSIDFPLNFSSPYKATNIIDFWQRWHITLTQYITTYVYSPVQFWISARRQAAGKKVSRKAQSSLEGFVSMIAFPLFFTMFIAGIWHGAGFQYIMYGVLHGFYLTINHAWRLYRHKKADATAISQKAAQPASQILSSFRHAASVLLTFGCVLVGQIFFRANSCTHAISILAGMLGAHAHAAAPIIADSTRGKLVINAAEVVAGFLIVWTLPNTQQILSRFKPSLKLTGWDEEGAPSRSLLWSPHLGWALALAGVLFISLVGLQDPSTFLYFQF